MDSYIFVKGLDSPNGDVKRVNLSEPISEELFNLPCFNTLGFFKNSVNELKTSPYFKENDGLFVKNITDNFPIKVINLDRRPDRWKQVKKQLDEQGIKNYSRFSAVDGTKLEMTNDIKFLFRNNDFNYRQGFIGCALSHLKLWNELIRDEENDYYIIMEDDFELMDDFKSKLNISLHQLIQKPFIDLHFLGYFYWNGEPKRSNDYPLMKIMDNKSYMGGFYGYIISKSAAFKLINISKYYGIQNGIDRFAHIHFDKMVVTHSEPHIIHSHYVVPGNNVDSDIQRNKNPIGVKSSDTGILDAKSLEKNFLNTEFRNSDAKDSDAKFLAYKYKVKVMTDWCSSKDMIKHLSKMTENNQNKWKDMIITDSDEADYYVIINKPRIDEYYKPEKTILYQMEPWIYDESIKRGVKTWGKWSKPEEMNLYKVLTHKYHYNLGEWHLNKTYSELMCSSFKKSKTISTFISEKNFDEGHIKRIEFMKFIESKEKSNESGENKFSYVDIYGRSNHGFKNYKGPLEFKNEGLIPYKYTICVENNSEHNYVTEKLYDGIIAECLCFYWGAPNIDEIIDSKAFIKLDLNNFEEAYQTIKQSIENNEWEKRLKYIKKEKIKILNKLQILPSIYKAIMTVEQKYNLTPLVHAGLGNQLFMIANAYSLSKQNNMNLVINNGYFGGRKSYWNTLFKNIKTENINLDKYEIINDEKFEYHDIKLPTNKNIAIKGYFQSDKFFKKYENEIKELFQIPYDIENISIQKIKSLNLEGEIICVHIRRGDYIGSSLHTVLPLEYYKQAIKIIKEKVSNPTFVFFSDDKKWVFENFEAPIIISCDQDYEELATMSQCRHFIIANSSFSWWGAYMSKNDSKIVISPKDWFLGNSLDWKDIYCDNWIVI